MKAHIAQVDSYYIAHDPSVHYGEVKVGQRVQTGQANLEIFENEITFKERLIELGIVLEDEDEEVLK
jgi:hypothetical protein